MSPADLRVVLPPQISPEFVGRLAPALGVAPEIVINIAVESRDYMTSSLVHAMGQAVNRGTARPGDLGLIIAAGAGIQVGCALYRF